MTRLDKCKYIYDMGVRILVAVAFYMLWRDTGQPACLLVTGVWTIVAILRFVSFLTKL